MDWQRRLDAQFPDGAVVTPYDEVEDTPESADISFVTPRLVVNWQDEDGSAELTIPDLYSPKVVITTVRHIEPYPIAGDEPSVILYAEGTNRYWVVGHLEPASRADAKKARQEWAALK